MLMEPLLEIRNLTVKYGGLTALNAVNMRFMAGEVVAIMGTNGAGKSTVLKTVFGLEEKSGGQVFWRGAELPEEAHTMVRHGIVYIPQGKRIFDALTVSENLELMAL